MFVAEKKNFHRRLMPVLMILLYWCVPSLLAQETAVKKLASDALDPNLKRGQAIYVQMCVSCHGKMGEGVKDAHADPLVGDATVGELSNLIADTMPKDESDKCIGKDAEAVADYIHYRFYSEAAQIRNRPPRVGLSRLTATQLRQSLSDLYAEIDGIAKPTGGRGIKGIYFDGSRWKNENKKLERVDPVIDFDFGTDSPYEGIKATDFYIYWEGSLKADVSGQYEIIIHSTCSFVFNFGTVEREFIDNHVQSGDKTEFRQSIQLTAGRVYPFKIDFIQRKRKTEQPPARISLAWIKPHGVEEIIPTSNLIPNAGPPAFALQAIQPPDDRSYGYERGIGVSRQWDDATTAAAIEFAQIAADELWPRFQKKNKSIADKDRAMLRRFLSELVSTAFRGSLTDELRSLYVDQQIDSTPDDFEAIKRVSLISLKSPYFLYPALDRNTTESQRVANRLALTLYDSMPNENWLWSEIKQNKLKSESQIRNAAKRMIDDYRVEAKAREMMHGWLNIGQTAEITKDQKMFPNFDAQLVADLQSSLDAFVDDILWSKSSDYRQLFKSDWTFTNGRLAAFYGDAWKPEGNSGIEITKSVRDSSHFGGVLTHPYVMSRMAYHNTTSPIHRGVFLIRYVLGRTLRPPNEAFTPLSPDLHPELTTRERVALQTSSDNCQSCHIKINGLGFALENWDAVGRFRSEEKSKAVDPQGSYTARSGQEVSFNGSNELADFLATSDDAQRAFISRAFQHFVKQPPAAYGIETLDRLTEKFIKNDFSIRELLVEIAVVAALGNDKTNEVPNKKEPES